MKKVIMNKKLLSALLIAAILTGIFSIFLQTTTVSAHEADATWGAASGDLARTYQNWIQQYDGQQYPYGVRDSLYGLTYGGTDMHGNSYASKSSPTTRGSYTYNGQVQSGFNYTNVSGNFVIVQRGSGGVTMESWYEHETAKDPVITQNTNTNVTPTFTYTGRDGTTYDSSTKPTSPGKYTVTAKGGDDKALYLLGWSATADFEIFPGYQITYMDGTNPFDKWADGFTPISVYQDGQTVTLPTTGNITVPEGKIFSGWYDNEGLTGNPVTEISADATGNKTFYAKWDNQTYTVSFMDGNDTFSLWLGDYIPNATYTFGTGMQLPLAENINNPLGKRFIGWYADAALTGNAITSIGTTETGNKTFYAQWEDIEYTITFKNGNTNFDLWNTGFTAPTTYKNGIQVTLPTTANFAIPANKVFDGWYETADFSGTTVTEIPANTYENKTFYAKFVDAIESVTLTGTSTNSLETNQTNRIQAGNTVTYTYELTNTGNVPATNFTFAIELPQDIVPDAADTTTSGIQKQISPVRTLTRAATTQTLQYTLNLPVGQNATVTVTGTVPENSTIAGNSFTATATLAGNATGDVICTLNHQVSQGSASIEVIDDIDATLQLIDATITVTGPIEWSNPNTYTLTTTDLGTQLPNLPLGTYEFTQTTAPQGYTLPENNTVRYSLISDGDVITHQIANAKIIIPEEPMVPAGETQTNLGSVQTGDHTAWILYSSLSVISLVMIAALLKLNRKKV